MTRRVWLCDDEPSARFPVFTRGNVGEVFSEVVSPLTWSAFGPHAWEAGWRDAFCEIGLFTPDEFKPPGQCEIVGCFGGYIYINMSVTRVLACRIPGLTVEAIDKSLFGDYPDIPPYRPDPRDQNAERTAQAATWLQSLFADDPKPVTDCDRLRIDALLAAQPDLSTLPDVALLDRCRSLAAEERYHFKRHVINTYGANVLASVIAQIAQATGAGELVPKITAAVGGVDSANQSLELWDLSRRVKTSALLGAAFDTGVHGLLERLRTATAPEASAFLAQWDAFIQRWGAIGPNVWEFRSPTYRSQPEIALRMLERARHASDAASPHERSLKLSAEREQATREIAQRLEANSEVRGQFLAAARSVGRFMAARERSKHHCALVIDAARAPLHEWGQRLVRRGLVSRWEHVLLVTNDEADAFLADPGAYRGRIGERAAQLEELKRKEPPFVFEGEPPPLAAFTDRIGTKPKHGRASVQLAGIGVSPGRYTGRARIVTSIAEDSALEPGEIIVAVTTDASWGPLFLTAGAIVVETGAAISHAAIVARELGIPAAVSVTGATQHIPQGAIITVDGNKGTVDLH